HDQVDTRRVAECERHRIAGKLRGPTMVFLHIAWKWNGKVASTIQLLRLSLRAGGGGDGRRCHGPWQCNRRVAQIAFAGGASSALERGGSGKLHVVRRPAEPHSYPYSARH